jgi:hypothetical protein
VSVVSAKEIVTKEVSTLPALSAETTAAQSGGLSAAPETEGGLAVQPSERVSESTSVAAAVESAAASAQLYAEDLKRQQRAARFATPVVADLSATPLNASAADWAPLGAKRARSDSGVAESTEEPSSKRQQHSAEGSIPVEDEAVVVLSGAVVEADKDDKSGENE